MPKNLQREAALQRLNQGKSVADIAKEAGYSRMGVYKIIGDRLSARIPPIKRFEVEIDKGENPQETIKFYEKMGYKYVDKYDDEEGSTVLLFSKPSNKVKID